MTGFPKSARVLKRADFRQTMDHGAKIVCPSVVLFATRRAPRPATEKPAKAGARKRKGDGPESRVRFGVVVSKKVGNSVVRNRVKRNLREAWRAIREDVESSATFAGVDVVALARPQAAESGGTETLQGLTKCIDRLARHITARSAKGEDGSPRRDPQHS
jgi:ribonuclease P protein component